jgi:hypothetical protein
MAPIAGAFRSDLARIPLRVFVLFVVEERVLFLNNF